MFPNDKLTFSFELEFRWKDQPFEAKESFSLKQRRAIERGVLEEKLILPKGWTLEHPPLDLEGPDEVYELKTASQSSLWHENTFDQWEVFQKDLNCVQGTLQGGFWSIHLHIGCPTFQGEEGRLPINKKRFGSLIKIYEAMWRFLAGLGYNSPQGIIAPTYGMDFLGIGYIEQHRLPKFRQYSMGVHSHGAIINLHEKLPTMEVKILTGLLGEKKLLDHENIVGDTRWCFALFHCAISSQSPIPLVTLGNPVFAGSKPSWKQIHRFLEVIYPDDPLGREMAMRRFQKHHNEPAKVCEEKTRNFADENCEIWKRLGLQTVFALHAEQEGYDSQIEERIANSPELMGRIASDYRNSSQVWKPSELYSNAYIIEALRNLH